MAKQTEEFSDADFQQDEFSASDFGEVEQTTAPTDPTSQQQFAPIASPGIIRHVIDPLLEFQRGFARGGESLFGKVDAITDMIAKTTGTTKGGLFEDFSKTMGNTAQQIPETGLHPVDKLGFQILGSAVPVATEFAAIKLPGAIGAAFKGAHDVAKFSILGALEEFRNDPDQKLSSLGKGAAKGAAVGMTFKTAGATLALLHKTNKSIARSFITFVTGNKRAAKRLVDNPSQLNLNPLGKTKSTAEIKEENAITKKNLEIKISDEKFAFTQKQKVEQQLLSQNLRDKEQALAIATTDAKANLSAKQGLTLEEQAKVSTKAISDMNNAVKDKAVSIYDSALQKFSLVKKNAGDAVKVAIDSTINKNPGAAIPFKAVATKINDTMGKLSPFELTKGNFVKPKTGLTPKEHVGTFQNFVNDIQSKQREGFSVRYLQDLKLDLKSLADKHFKSGDKRLGALYSQLSKDVDPAKIVSGDKGLSNRFPEIAEANKRFSDLVPKYEAAMKNYFQKDASGNFIPNPSKSFNAIAGGDSVSLRQMQKADKLLPKEDQLLPKMKELVSMSDKNIAHQKGITNSLKRQAQKERNELQRSTKESMLRLKKNNRNLTNVQKEGISREIRNFSEGKASEYNQVIKDLTKREEFYAEQDALRSFAATRKTGAGIIQTVLAFSSIPGLRTGSPAISPALFGVAALSPVGASNIARSSLKATQTLDAILSPILRNQGVQRLTGSEIIRRSTSQQQTQ